ncbi:MAG: indole-3-glycerol phosphate synthase TrpC [Sediminibacterium sp.]|nr:indole-3-glycerol phosphate synthase TrpC [Sediminibacterium sp.]
MNILDTIIAQKRIEVAEHQAIRSLEDLQKMPLFSRPTRSLKQSLTDPSKTGIIAEYKRKSPSKGIINATAAVEAVTAAYTANGASGLSVLTDEPFFGGTLSDLVAARANEVPILRKDFMISEYQLAEARAFGADVILLIAACLRPDEVQQLAVKAKELELEVLLEIHNEAELEHVCPEVDLVGINNRNLKDFEVDIHKSMQLLNMLPADKPAVAESGIHSVDTIVTLQKAGFKGFLIGERFMKASNPSIAFADFVQELKVKQHAG